MPGTSNHFSDFNSSRRLFSKRKKDLSNDRENSDSIISNFKPLCWTQKIVTKEGRRRTTGMPADFDLSLRSTTWAFSHKCLTNPYLAKVLYRFLIVSAYKTGGVTLSSMFGSTFSVWFTELTSIAISGEKSSSMTELFLKGHTCLFLERRF